VPPPEGAEAGLRAALRTFSALVQSFGAHLEQNLQRCQTVGTSWLRESDDKITLITDNGDGTSKSEAFKRVSTSKEAEMESRIADCGGQAADTAVFFWAYCWMHNRATAPKATNVALSDTNLKGLWKLVQIALGLWHPANAAQALADVSDAGAALDQWSWLLYNNIWNVLATTGNAAGLRDTSYMPWATYYDTNGGYTGPVFKATINQAVILSSVPGAERKLLTIWSNLYKLTN
jgi:hypothetical protein